MVRVFLSVVSLLFSCLDSEIGHRLITQDLQTMVNQSRNFPCFDDVLKTVDKTNEKHQLHLR